MAPHLLPSVGTMKVSSGEPRAATIFLQDSLLWAASNAYANLGPFPPVLCQENFSRHDWVYLFFYVLSVAIRKLFEPTHITLPVSECMYSIRFLTIHK